MPKPRPSSYPEHQRWRFLQRFAKDSELIAFAKSIVEHHGMTIDDILPDLLNFVSNSHDNWKRTWLRIWVNLMHQMGVGYTWEAGKKLYATELGRFLAETSDLNSYYMYWALRFQFPFTFPKQKHYIENGVAIQPVIMLLEYLIELSTVAETGKSAFMTGEEIVYFLMRAKNHDDIRANCLEILHKRSNRYDYTSNELDIEGFEEAAGHLFSRGKLFIQRTGLIEFQDDRITFSSKTNVEAIKTFLSLRKEPITFTVNSQDMRNHYMNTVYNNLDPYPSVLFDIFKKSMIVIPNSEPASRVRRRPIDGEEADLTQFIENPSNLAANFGTASRKYRPFQGKLRDDLLILYKGKCSICGLDRKDFLVASHVIPVSVDPSIAQDRTNCILLCALHDKAFEYGYIGLSDDFRVVTNKNKISKLTHPVLQETLVKKAGVKILLPSRLPPALQHVKRHRDIHGIA